MFCKNCGTNVDGYNFCPKCGAPAAQSQDQSQTYNSFQQPTYNPMMNQNYMPVQPKPVQAGSVPASPSEASAVLVIGIFALICAFLPIFLFPLLSVITVSSTHNPSDSTILGLLSVFPICSVLSFVLAIVGKTKSGNYIKTYGQYPGKVRAGRILSNIAMPFSIFFLVISFFIFIVVAGAYSSSTRH